MAYTSMSGACCAPCASGRACTAASLAVGDVFSDAAAKAEQVFTKKTPPLKPAVATTASSSHLGLIAVVGAAALGVVLLARRRRRR